MDSRSPLPAASVDGDPAAPLPPEEEIARSIQLVSYLVREGIEFAIVPLFEVLRHSAKGYLSKHERKLAANDEGPPKVITGRIQLEVPNEVVENLQGPEEERDLFLVLQVPRAALDDFREARRRAELGIEIPRLHIPGRG